MHALYKLKDMLCQELEEYGERGELSAGSLEIVDTLAHAIKNLDCVIMAKEDEMEGSYEGGSNEGGSNRSNRGRYESGYSSRRGRDSRGRYTSRRGYSRADDMAQQLKNLAEQMEQMK